ARATGVFDGPTKVRRRRNLGFTARKKFALQVLVAFGLGSLLLWMHALRIYNTNINFPFFKQFKPDLLLDSFLQNPWTYPLAFVFFFGFVALVLVGASNAVNLTDGLDGLAIGLMVVASGALTILAYGRGHGVFADYLGLDTNTLAAELTIFCGALTGASIGFLWYNAHPAEIFMGDVGSLSLGAGMAIVAVL